MKLESKGKDLVEHWTWASKKGLMNSNTAGALRAACTQVLGCLDDWEDVEIGEIDVEHTIHRFTNLRAKDFTPKSLETYASRFRKAVGMFQDYISNPSGWRPTQRTSKSKNLPKEKNKESPETRMPEESRTTFHEQKQTGMDLIQYPFPLRDGLIAVIKIPVDLSKTEAERMSAFLNALAVKD